MTNYLPRPGQALVTIILLAAGACLAAPAGITIQPARNEVGLYEPVFLNITVPDTVANPFDPDEMRVDVALRSPSDSTIRLPAFFDGMRWQARFTPAEVGRYECRAEVTRYGRTEVSSRSSFRVKPSNRNGFLRVNSASPFTFRFDSGQEFRGVGMNVAWADDYEHYFRKLHENGLQVARVFTAPWHLYLEWKDPGLGRYHLAHAEQLDRLLELAERYDIYLILCLDYHGEVQKEQGYFNENSWADNPYNAVNGGPCAGPADFFTDTRARANYRKRLRYLAARYGYSPRILCWELWNEVDLTAGEPDAVVDWHREMARELRRVDPHGHMISTSFVREGWAAMYALPEMDFTQTHIYNPGDMARAVAECTRERWLADGKPHVIGEFGTEFRGAIETRIKDPCNVEMHNGVWAGLFSPTPVMPLTWWWDDIVDLDDGFSEFRGAAAFARTMRGPLTVLDLPELEAEYVVPKRTDLSDSGTHSFHEKLGMSGAAVIRPVLGWHKSPLDTFVIDARGHVDQDSLIPSILFGYDKRSYRSVPGFRFSCAMPGRFTVRIGKISNTGLLRIRIDEELALLKPLPLGPGAAECETSSWYPEWNTFQGVYNRDYSVIVPAGVHCIRIDNAGEDWMEVLAYRWQPNVVAPMKTPENDRLLIFPTMDWGKCPDTQLVIDSRGHVEGGKAVPFYLYNKGKEELRSPVEFTVTYARPGRFQVRVVEVSYAGLLRIYLDGRLSLSKPLPLAAGKGEWQSVEWKEEWKRFQGVYNRTYGIDVPAGRHTIRVDNAGTDWLTISRYEYLGTGIRRQPRLKVMGLRGEKTVHLWIRNEDYNPAFTAAWGLPKTVHSLTPLRLTGVQHGKYRVEWWDTRTGTLIREDSTSAGQDRILELRLPMIANDIAARVIATS